jgi:hypothetical protein
MEPTVYLEVNFLDRFDLVQKDESTITPVDIVTENKNQLAKVLTNSLLVCADISDKEVKNIFKKNGSTSKPTTHRELFLSIALRKGKFSKLESDYSDAGAIYLLDKNSEECKKIELEHNVICRGNDHDFSDNIIPKTIGTVHIDQNMNGIEAIEHRCRNMILLDPHIFEDTDTDNYEPKIPNLVRFLKVLNLNNNSTKCHLSIITKNPESDPLVNKKIKAIKDGLGNQELEISVFCHKKKNEFEGNRRFITDYALMDAQHIFDRDNASLSANFMFDGDNIKRNYNEVNEFLDRIKVTYNKNVRKIGFVTYKFQNILNNQLFKT